MSRWCVKRLNFAISDEDGKELFKVKKIKGVKL